MYDQTFIEDISKRDQRHHRAILIGVYETADKQASDARWRHSLDELWDLARACEYEPVAELTQRLEHRTPAYYIGSGKIDEIHALAEETDATLLIFNDTLSPSQLKNLSRELTVEIMDRTGLILEIFRDRARTREARLQVELARLQYIKPRLIGMWETQNRQGGASGSMSSKGEGETQLELDRRSIDHRLAALRRELKEVVRERQTQRKHRQASDLPVVSLIGYTNAGKSSIMNALVGMFSNDEKKVFEHDMLFATLDTTVRRIRTSASDRHSGFLLSDTVGFVQQLPTSLIEAFKSTLEELSDADLLLQVVDYSDPARDEHIEVTRDILRELGAGGIPMIIVYNKCDLAGKSAAPDKTALADKQHADTNEIPPEEKGHGFDAVICQYPRRGMSIRERSGDLTDCIYISAKDEASVRLLAEVVEEKLQSGTAQHEFFIPYEQGAVLSDILAHASVLCSEYAEDGVRLRIRSRAALPESWSAFRLPDA